MNKALDYVIKNKHTISMWLKTETGITVFCKGGKKVIFEFV